MSYDKEFINLYLNRYKLNSYSFKILNAWLNKPHDFFSIRNNKKKLVAATLVSRLGPLNLNRIGFLVSKKEDKTIQNKAEILFNNIIKKYPKNSIAFCNKYSVDSAKRGGFIEKQIEECEILYEETGSFNVKNNNNSITEWQKFRYIDHNFKNEYIILKYKEESFVLKKWENTCHLLDYNIKNFNSIIEVIKYYAFKVLNCKNLTFWNNAYISNNIKKTKKETFAIFSNKKLYNNLKDHLYMGLSDVY